MKLPISWTGQSRCPVREMGCAYDQFMNWANCLPIAWIGQLKICSVHKLGKLCVRRIIFRTQSPPVDWLDNFDCPIREITPDSRVNRKKSVTRNAGNVIFSWQRMLQEAQLSLTNRAMLVCKVVEVWQDLLSEYVDKKFTYVCYRRLIRHEWIYLLLLVRVSFTIIGQPRNSVLIGRV